MAEQADAASNAASESVDHGFVGVLTPKTSPSSFENFAHSKLDSHTFENIFTSERGAVYRVSGPNASTVVDELRKFRSEEEEISICEDAWPFNHLPAPDSYIAQAISFDKDSNSAAVALLLASDEEVHAAVCLKESAVAPGTTATESRENFVRWALKRAAEHGCEEHIPNSRFMFRGLCMDRAFGLFFGKDALQGWQDSTWEGGLLAQDPPLVPPCRAFVIVPGPEENRVTEVPLFNNFP